MARRPDAVAGKRNDAGAGMETKGAALRTALQLIPRRTNLANAFVFNGRVEWQFSQTSDGRRHFWSTDDIECLWCRRRLLCGGRLANRKKNAGKIRRGMERRK